MNCVGTTCFQCAYKDGGFSDQENEDCELANTKFAKTCPDSKSDHCLKISGLVDGKGAGLRQCSEENWALLVGGSDKCIPSLNISNFAFKIDGRPVPLTDGVVCVCTGYSCNSQARNFPNPIPAIIALFLSIILPILY